MRLKLISDLLTNFACSKIDKTAWLYAIKHLFPVLKMPIFAANLNSIALENFAKLGIKDDFIKGLNEMNILVPTPVQGQVIPLLLDGSCDLVAQAQTGTGKTAAFGLPLLAKVDPLKKVVQGLILCPTRELGQQVAKQLFKYTKYTDKIFVESVYGGAPIDKQIYALKRPTHIIVATPGRLIDLIKRKAVDLKNVKTVVLDEADEMLSMGFKKELDEILNYAKSSENKWLFSATMPQGIKQIVDTHLSDNAHQIEISGRNVVNTKIEHQYLICEDGDKLNELLRFLKSKKDERGIIFCKTKTAAKKLTKQLIARHVSADAIHGDLLQKERDKVMRAFKNESLQLLIATDIAARGIDIAALAYVVHYQLPDKDEYYTHRSGRTARAGKEGVSFCLVNSAEKKQLRFYEKTLDIAFKQV